MRTLTSLQRVAALAIALALVILTTRSTPAAGQAGDRERTLYVSALDAEGEPVEGLGPDAFVVREDGVRREILRVSRATEPVDIALLADNSAAAQSEVIFIRQALTTFVAALSPGNSVALVGLADRPTILVDYTNDPKRFSDGVGRLFAMPQAGMTLLDAVGEVSRGLGRRESSRAAIVAVLTDGPEFGNRYSQDLVRDLKKAGATFYAMALGQFPFSNVQGIRERSFLLDQGPRSTGGYRETLLAPNGLEGAMRKLARQISNQYRVIYSRPQSLIPPEEVTVTSGRESITVRGTVPREPGADR